MIMNKEVEMSVGDAFSEGADKSVQTATSGEADKGVDTAMTEKTMMIIIKEMIMITVVREKAIGGQDGQEVVGDMINQEAGMALREEALELSK